MRKICSALLAVVYGLNAGIPLTTVTVSGSFATLVTYFWYAGTFTSFGGKVLLYLILTPPALICLFAFLMFFVYAIADQINPFGVYRYAIEDEDHFLGIFLVPLLLHIISRVMVAEAWFFVVLFSFFLLNSIVLFYSAIKGLVK